MLVTVLTLALILLAYFITQDVLITLIIGVGILFFMKSLQPYLDLLYVKLFPMPQIKKLREVNMTEEAGRGVRIMAVSQFTEFDPSDTRSVELYDSIVGRAVEKLRESKPLFDLRYGTVLERELPMQYAFSVCGEKNSGTRKCYKAWLKEIKEKDFGIWKENSELFLHDDFFEDPATGEQRSSLVLFMFDSRLPKTLKNNEGEQKQQAQE